MSAAGTYVAPFSVERHVGRLIEVRAHDLGTTTELHAFTALVTRMCAGIPAGAVVCGDYRQTWVLPPDMVEGWVAGFRRVGARINRSVVLVDPANAAFNLQVRRVVSADSAPHGRLALSVAEAIAWLTPALEPEERRRAEAFLAARRPPSGRANGATRAA